MSRELTLRIKRQNSPTSESYWQEFRVEYKKGMNIISCLQAIARKPVDAQGKKTTPVVWDCSCLEEVCGACSMLVNGKPMQSCSTLVDNLPDGPITLEPLSKYPIVRDLAVDRQPMFEALKQVKAWIPIDGTYAMGPGPRRGTDEAAEAYVFSRCMTCGCCMEACPNYDGHNPKQFIGPAPLGQAYYFGLNPTGKLNHSERLDALMTTNGIVACGNAQNCVEVCPKEIPLTEAISQLNRQVNRKWWSELFGK